MYEVERLVVKIVGDASSFNAAMNSSLANMASFHRTSLAMSQQTIASITRNLGATTAAIDLTQKRYDRLQNILTMTRPGTKASQMITDRLSDMKDHLNYLRDVRIGLNQQDAAYNSLQARVGRFTQQVRANFAEMTMTLQQVGTNITRYVTVPFALAMGLSIAQYAKFDKGVSRAMAVFGSTNSQDRLALEGAVLGVSENTSKPVADTANALYDLASAGYSVERAIKALPLIETFATASGINMEKSTRLLTESLNALGLAHKDPEENMKNMLRVSDAIVKANNLSSATAEQFAVALENKFAKALNITNKSLEEGLAVLAVYAQQGVKGRLAGEYGTRMLRDLQTIAIKNKDAWQMMGLSVYDATGEMLPMWDIMGQLEKRFENATPLQRRQALLMLGMTSRTTDATLALYGTSKQMKEFYDDLHKAGGETSRVSDQMKQSLSEQLGILLNKFRILGIQLATAFMPTLQKIITAVSGVTLWFNKLNDGTKGAIVNTLAIVALSGPLLLLFTGIIAAMTSIYALIGWPGVLAAGLVGLFFALGGGRAAMSELKNDWATAWSSIKKDIAGGDLERAFDTLGKTMSVSWRSMLNSIVYDLELAVIRIGLSMVAIARMPYALYKAGAGDNKFKPGSVLDKMDDEQQEFVEKYLEDYKKKYPSKMDIFGEFGARKRLKEHLATPSELYGPRQKEMWDQLLKQQEQMLANPSILSQSQKLFSNRLLALDQPAGFDHAWSSIMRAIDGKTGDAETRQFRRGQIGESILSWEEFGANQKDVWSWAMDAIGASNVTPGWQKGAQDLFKREAEFSKIWDQYGGKDKGKMPWYEKLLEQSQNASWFSRVMDEKFKSQGDAQLQRILDTQVERNKVDFQQINLRQFQLEGPGGLARGAERLEGMKVNDPVVAEKLQKLIELNGGGPDQPMGRERLDNREE